MCVDHFDPGRTKTPNRNHHQGSLLPYCPPEVRKQTFQHDSASLNEHADCGEQREYDSLLLPNSCFGTSDGSSARSDPHINDMSEREQVWNEVRRRLAHDLNNYVSVVMGRAQLLAERCTADEEMTKDCVHIIAASLRIAAMIKKLSLGDPATFDADRG